MKQAHLGSTLQQVWCHFCPRGMQTAKCWRKPFFLFHFILTFEARLQPLRCARGLLGTGHRGIRSRGDALSEFCPSLLEGFRVVCHQCVGPTDMGSALMSLHTRFVPGKLSIPLGLWMSLHYFAVLACPAIKMLSSGNR